MEPCNISSDVLLEILSRVNLKTLSKCRLLSRECNRLTYESSFMRLHCQRTKTVAGYFIQSLKSNRFYSTFLSIDNPGLDPQLSLNFLPARSVKILATVDQGLVFCVSEDDCYYICKPSTKQWEIVPSPNLGTFTRKVGMVVIRSDPLQFKIIRLSDGHEYSNSELDLEDSIPKIPGYKRFHCELFDSSTWSWNRLNDVILPWDEFFNTKPAISAYGGLHWLTSNKEKNNILSFYADQESWELVSLPDSLCQRGQWNSVNLAECEGKLTLICVKPEFDFVELWIMKDFFGERVWSKRHTVNLKAFNQENGHSSANSFYNADTLLMIGIYIAIFYNFKNGRFDRLELDLKHTYPNSTFFVQTNYEPIQLRQPRKNSIFSVLPSPSPVFIVCWVFILVFSLLFILDV
ncbi:hypothetical protein PTKIN_Ptkin19aG0084900 [Pterospermum kingtungense]